MRSRIATGFTGEIIRRKLDKPVRGPKQVQLPVGLEFLGRPFEEAKLFEIASAYEKVKRRRRPPEGFGSLPREP
jgi:hypothetical protein